MEINLTDIRNCLAGAAELNHKIPKPAFDIGIRNARKSNLDALNREDSIASWNMLCTPKIEIRYRRDPFHKGPLIGSLEGNPVWEPIIKTIQISMIEFLESTKEDRLNALTRLFRNAMDEILIDMENTTVGLLFSNRSQQVNKADWLGTFSATNYVFEIPLDRKKNFFQDIASMMGVNGHNGKLDLLVDPIAGESDAFDNPDVSRIPHLCQINTLYPIHGFALAMPVEAFAVATWVPMENKEGKSEGGVKYGVIEDPASGLTFAVRYCTERANTLWGSQDQETKIEVCLDYCFMAKPFSDATESAIYAAALV